MRRIPLAILAVLLVLPARLAAQEDQGPTKWTGVDWYTVVNIDFAPGKTADAVKIIREHFMKASDAAGTPKPVMVLMDVTGPWDMTVVWKMQDGPTSLEWRRSPENVKWWAAFVKQEGSEEAARKIQEEYGSYVARSSSTITRTMDMSGM